MEFEKKLVALCKQIQEWSKLHFKNPTEASKKKFELLQKLYAKIDDHLASKPVAKPKGGSKVSVRLPALEVFAQQVAVISAALSDSIRPLTKKERDIAKFVFQSSLRLDEIQIEEKALIANAPTTLGNVIRLSDGYTMSDATLVHELTHVWQFQNKGTGYISNSVVHQVEGMLSDGDRNAAYVVTIQQGASFSSYSAEHQATIVEDWYSKPALRKDSEYIRLISEVRGSLPPVNLNVTQTYIETMYGPQTQNQKIMDMMDAGKKDKIDIPGNIIRIEF
jgi:hypothetical protein